MLSTSLGKTFLAWRFILNENIDFCLTIPYQKPFVFSVSAFSALFSNVYSKMGLTYAISKVNWIFGNILFENIFCFSL